MPWPWSEVMSRPASTFSWSAASIPPSAAGPESCSSAIACGSWAASLRDVARSLSRRYGINPKTVAKWKKRGSVADLKTGPKEAKSTVLSIADEAIVFAFRKHTLLPLDDCLYALQATIPHLTRSSLHRRLRATASRGCRRRQGREARVQGLSHRGAYRRSSQPEGAAPSLRGHRPDFKVRLHRAAQEATTAVSRGATG